MAKKTPAPTIRVTGTATKIRTPDRGEIHIRLTSTNRDREIAWTDFQTRLRSLKTAVGSLGELVDPIPNENTKTVERQFRSYETTTITSRITINFDIGEFGSIIQKLVEHKFDFSTPNFSYSRISSTPLELLREAAEDANRRAQLVGEGLGHHLGRLVSAQTHEPVHAERKMPFTDWLTASPHLLHSHQHVSNNDSVSPELFDIKAKHINSQEIVVTVTAEFELVANPPTAKAA